MAVEGGEAVVMDTAGVDVDGAGGAVMVMVLLDPAATVGVDGLVIASTSFSRRRLVPRDVLSLRPSDVALIRI